MIPQKSTAYQVESTIQGEKIAMGLDPRATAHLMGVLTNLYSDNILAVIREYSTNARDAHIALGYEGPIEVTLPNELTPLLVVEDHGIGLSADDIRNIYSQYGASTKRDSDDFNGTLGLGCKAALAYAQQFTFVSVKDHKRTTVVVSREVDGGSMTVNEVIDTTEPSGTKIIIPTNPGDHEEFHSKAAFLFSFWEPGTVLVDGEEPAQISGLPIGDEIKLIEGAQNYIVMGGVPYPCKIPTGLNNRGIAAWVPMGSVEFAPTRESLIQDSRLTKDCVAAVVDVLHHHLSTTVQKAIDNCSTREEALVAMVEWDHLLPRQYRSVTYTFQGEQLPINYVPKGMAYSAERHQSYGTKIGRHDRNRVIHANLWTNALWVTGYDRASYTPTTRKKIDKHVEEAGDRYQGVRHYFVVEDSTLEIASWVNPDRIVSWKTAIEPIKLPRKGRDSSGRPAASYDLYEVRQGVAAYHNGIESDDIDESHPLFYFDPKMDNALISELSVFYNDYTLVELSPNRVNKFERDYPQAQRASTVLRNHREAWIKTVSNSARLAHTVQNMDYWQKQKWNAISKHADKLHDPAIRRVIKLMTKDISAVSEKAKALGIAGRLSLSEWDDPMDKYPLVDYDNADNTEHVIMYMNAAYAASK